MDRDVAAALRRRVARAPGGTCAKRCLGSFRFEVSRAVLPRRSPGPRIPECGTDDERCATGRAARKNAQGSRMARVRVDDGRRPRDADVDRITYESLGDARPCAKALASMPTPRARSIRPEARPAMAGAWVRFVMNPMRTTSAWRARHAVESEAPQAPARSSRRESTAQASLALRNVCNPHSVLPLPAHRPDRSSSPSATA